MATEQSKREALDHLTNAELIRHTDNTPNATELARELANRLDRALQNRKRGGYDVPGYAGENHDPRPAN
jgi:hypothetical protein